MLAAYKLRHLVFDLKPEAKVRCRCYGHQSTTAGRLISRERSTHFCWIHVVEELSSSQLRRSNLNLVAFRRAPSVITLFIEGDGALFDRALGDCWRWLANTLG
jgi:hypothetical protein